MDIENNLSEQERVELGRRITLEITRLIERFGRDHPLLDELIEQCLLDILSENE